MLDIVPIANADAIEAVRITPKAEAPVEGRRPEKFRIRTMTLRGCLSQGLFLPLAEAGVGDDVSDAVGVTKYDPPLRPGTKNERAGVVIRPRVERASPTLLGRLSFKAISNCDLIAERD